LVAVVQTTEDLNKLPVKLADLNIDPVGVAILDADDEALRVSNGNLCRRR